MADKDLFNTAMDKVTRLADSDKAHIEKAKPSASVHQVRSFVLRPHALQIPIHQPHTCPFQLKQNNNPWELIANGVSREHLKRLAAGSPAIDHHYDLHGMTRDAALSMLQDAILQASDAGERVLCIVHGRGLHSQGRAILKDAVYQWLREGPLAHMILAAIPQPHSGGGACLVLLRRHRIG